MQSAISHDVVTYLLSNTTFVKRSEDMDGIILKRLEID